MSIHRQAAKRDGNERAIVVGLRRAGASVQQLSAKGCPDLLVGFRQRTHLLEVKEPGKKLTPDQTEWHGYWQGAEVHVVHDLREAISVLLGGEG